MIKREILKESEKSRFWLNGESCVAFSRGGGGEREAELNVSLSFRSPLLPSGEAATAKVIRDKVVALNIQIGNLW